MIPYGAYVIEEPEPVKCVLKRSMGNPRSTGGRYIEFAPTTERTGIAQSESLKQRRAPTQSPRKERGGKHTLADSVFVFGGYRMPRIRVIAIK